MHRLSHPSICGREDVSWKIPSVPLLKTRGFQVYSKRVFVCLASSGYHERHVKKYRRSYMRMRVCRFFLISMVVSSVINLQGFGYESSCTTQNIGQSLRVIFSLLSMKDGEIVLPSFRTMDLLLVEVESSVVSNSPGLKSFEALFF